MYVVVVDFTIKPERLAEFMPLMLENARASRETEPGCRVFDVCVDFKERTKVFLYEVYDDRGAFDAHWRRRTSSASTPRWRRWWRRRRCASSSASGAQRR